MSSERIELLAARADALRALHRPGRPVVLPNAWDVASAKRFVKMGYAAIATTSAGVGRFAFVNPEISISAAAAVAAAAPPPARMPVLIVVARKDRRSMGTPADQE